VDRVALAGGSLRVSRLGYGCAALMARTGRRESVSLLEAAFEAGVTHFDVARSYGYGEAESALGEFAAGRRDRVTIATKLGIAPPPRSRRLDLARGAARRLVAVAPPLRRLVRRQAERLVARGDFEVGAARASLETSLRELRTEYVDLLLLHDCAPQEVTDELLGFLRGRVAAGQVRAYGIATDLPAAREILAAHPDEALVPQVPLDLLDPGSGAGGRPLAAGFVAHSVLSSGLDPLHAWLHSPRVDLEEWSSRLETDLADRAALGRLMLRAAIAANPEAAFLFSSRDEGRLRENATLAASPPDPELARRFGELAAALQR
jgi:D-threo-aldose 1-dehydrogenase